MLRRPRPQGSWGMGRGVRRGAPEGARSQARERHTCLWLYVYPCHTQGSTARYRVWWPDS